MLKTELAQEAGMPNTSQKRTCMQIKERYIGSFACEDQRGYVMCMCDNVYLKILSMYVNELHKNSDLILTLNY